MLSDHGNEQVIAPFLIIRRVANRRALTSEAVASGGSSLRFGSRGETTDSDGTLADGAPTSSTDAYGEVLRDHGDGAEITWTNSHHNTTYER